MKKTILSLALASAAVSGYATQGESATVLPTPVNVNSNGGAQGGTAQVNSNINYSNATTTGGASTTSDVGSGNVNINNSITFGRSRAWYTSSADKIPGGVRIAFYRNDERIETYEGTCARVPGSLEHAQNVLVALLNQPKYLPSGDSVLLSAVRMGAWQQAAQVCGLKPSSP